mmetsp:Transcript_34538/g.53924  ORF Transcript_34538/g.53924 Transcript_34538/m.53924 type:complete len:146 (+) Transcript_34538:70-507(+)
MQQFRIVLVEEEIQKRENTVCQLKEEMQLVMMLVKESRTPLNSSQVQNIEQNGQQAGGLSMSRMNNSSTMEDLERAVRQKQQQLDTLRSEFSLLQKQLETRRAGSMSAEASTIGDMNNTQEADSGLLTGTSMDQTQEDDLFGAQI